MLGHIPCDSRSSLSLFSPGRSKTMHERMELPETFGKLLQWETGSNKMLTRWGLPRWFSVKKQKQNLPADAEDTGLTPESRRCPGEGNGSPLQYSCLENRMDRGAWCAIVHGVTKSWTWLRDRQFQFPVVCVNVASELAHSLSSFFAIYHHFLLLHLLLTRHHNRFVNCCCLVTLLCLTLLPVHGL